MEETGSSHLARVGLRPVVTGGPDEVELCAQVATGSPAVHEHLHRVIWLGRSGHRGDPHPDTVDPLREQITVAEVLTEVVRLLAGSVVRVPR